jgi:transcriptional regulator with XRE-family HTH domain
MKIKQLRQQQKISLRKLAELTGIGYGALAEIEKGTRLVDDKKLERIAQALGVSKEELLR